jgi:MFS family permease
VFDTTLVLWVGTVLLSGRSYAPAAESALLLCVAVATLVVGPIAGVFVDRWDRRRTMLRADLIRAGLVGILAAVAFLPADALPVPATLALIYAVVLLSATAAQFFNPARFALIGDVVEGDAVLIALGALYAAAALREVDRPDPATEVVHASPPRR